MAQKLFRKGARSSWGASKSKRVKPPVILSAASLSGNGSIFVPQLGSPHKIVDLARYMIGGEVEIPIIFTGLRPGEKMTEAMKSPCETVDPIAERELYRIRNATLQLENLDDSIAELARNAIQNDLVAALHVIQRLVPDFIPSDVLSALLDSHHSRVVRA